MAEKGDPDSVFANVVRRVKNGEMRRYHVEVEDSRGTVFLIESEPWGRGCLTYASVQDLALANDAERLGASVFRFVCGHAECQWRHVRTEWVRSGAVISPPTEFGVSVMLFYRDKPPVSPM